MTTALWLFLWLLAPQAPSGALGGRVAFSDTDLPLVNEVVGLWPSGQVARTDQNGKFLFSGVPAGQYALIVVRDRIRIRMPITLASAQKIEDLRLEVKPAPAIAGTVFDPFGQRLAAARVQAFRMVYRPTGARIRGVLSVMSDDLGEYRLFHLPLGEYYVSASYSDRDQRAGGAGYRFSPNVSRADDGFPTLYFGGGYSATQSQKTLLRDADNVGTNIYLKEGPRFAVSGRLVRAEGDACGQVAIIPEGGLVDPDKDLSANVCGAFTLTGLSPGSYVLIAIGPGLASEAIAVYLANKSVDKLIVPMEQTINVRGRIIIDGVSALANNPAVNRRVVLSRNSNEITQRLEAVSGSEGRFEVQNVGPGSFDVLVEGLPEGAYVRSIRQGGLDLLTRPALMRLGTADIEIQVSTRGAKTEGVVVDMGGRPIPGAQVVLIPATNRNREDRYFSAFADAGGNFTITGIAPGAYTAFAFEDIEPGAYYAFTYDIGLGARWQVRGQRIEFAEGGDRQQLKLSGIPASDTIGGLR